MEESAIIGVAYLRQAALATVTDERYIDWLKSLGCKVTLFVEYVPFEQQAFVSALAKA